MHQSNTPISLCTHLTVPSPDEYFVWFTGRGADYHWVCRECASTIPTLSRELADAKAQELVTATESLLQNCDAEAMWEGIVGTPEIARRATALKFEHRELTTPFSCPEQVIDIQPDPRSHHWIVLLSSGELAIYHPEDGQLDVACRLSDLGFPLDAETALSVSPWQDYAAICQSSDRLACAFQLATGKITARIDRGEYRPQNSRFPIAFFSAEGQTRLVAATAWNRLDIIDPASGENLTDRPSPVAKSGEPRPEHYLDYFHAGLTVSAGSTWIADSGWIWHPFGVVRCWNLQDWLRGNRWESEDGASLRTFAGRNYYWDGPLCWIDDSTLAIWGWGGDDEWLIPAVQIFDVPTRQEIGWFPGPEARSPNAWPPKKQPPSLFFDRYLFSTGGSGTSVWDVSTGELLHRHPTLTPIQYHPRSKEFLSLTSAGIRLSRLKE